MKREDSETTSEESTKQPASWTNRNGRGRIEHLSAATGLILTYLIEIGVQIFLTIHCCSSLVMLTLNWDWSLLVRMSQSVSSLVVSTVSLVWVCHSLDFAGRLCGRLLCYVMHFFLLGLPWRYLKLAFAYDPADVQEFVALRIFQAYIQSLPLTSIHIATLITFQQGWTSPIVWLVATEAFSIVTALIIASYITPVKPSRDVQVVHSEKLKTTGNFRQNLKCSSTNNVTDDNIMWCRVLSIELNLLSRGLLLCCRLLAIGFLFTRLTYWTFLLTLVHLLISFTWLSFHDNSSSSLQPMNNGSLNPGFNDPSENTKFTLHYRIIKSSYVLFWDITSSLCDELGLWTWVLPAGLVLGENAALIFYQWKHGLLENRLSEPLVMTSACCLILGSILFSFLNLCTLSHWTKLFGTRIERTKKSSSLFVSDIDSEASRFNNGKEEMDSSKLNNGNEDEPVRRTRSSSSTSTLPTREIPKVVIPSGGIKGTTTTTKGSSPGLVTLDKTKPLIMANNYTAISEVLMTAGKIRRVSSISGEKRAKSLKPPEVRVTQRGLPPEVSSSMKSSSPPLLTGTGHSWVPDKCCSNDSNGSSNSRNTNTLEIPSTSQTQPRDSSGGETLGNTTHFVFCYPTEEKSSRNHYHRKIPTGIETNQFPPTQSYSKDGPCNENLSQNYQIRTTTPVEIKRASRVIMNYPKHSEERTRCPCQSPMRDSLQPNSYDKLMESSYGILFCEGTESLGKVRQDIPTKRYRGIFPPPIIQNHSGLKLRVLCAKCFQNHDPLLTDCQNDNDGDKLDTSYPFPFVNNSSTVLKSHGPPVPSSETTDYPSETEMTWTAVDDEEVDEVESLVTSLHSTATYTTWPHAHAQMWTASSMIPGAESAGISKEFTSREYVRTWLLTSQARERHQRHLNRVHKSKKCGNRYTHAPNFVPYSMTLPHPSLSNRKGRRRGSANITNNEKLKFRSCALPLKETSAALQLQQVKRKGGDVRPRTPIISDRVLSQEMYYKDLEIIL